MIAINPPLACVQLPEQQNDQRRVDRSCSRLSQVLSPYQHAVLEVQSFPHKVDLLAICNAILSQSPAHGQVIFISFDCHLVCCNHLV